MVPGGAVIEVLGLDAVSESVYWTMLELPVSGAAQLAAHLRQPEETILQALERLASMSLVRRQEDAPSVWHPVSPELGLEALIARQEASLARQQEQVSESRNAMAAFLAQCTPLTAGTPNGQLERLQGEVEVRLRFERMVQQADKELMAHCAGRATRRFRPGDLRTARCDGTCPGGCACASCAWRAWATRLPVAPIAAGQPIAAANCAPARLCPCI
ncbi:helix-turn-helix domain-containing protein [Streptacidiphilus sp. BW17]|uniref:helix-turn-helix domain-containing protein n=1 Tax=Streptacidiphilus sp. BW17 TaxID=3156274 RepID=UPI003512F9EA